VARGARAAAPVALTLRRGAGRGRRYIPLLLLLLFFVILLVSCFLLLCRKHLQSCGARGTGGSARSACSPARSRERKAACWRALPSMASCSSTTAGATTSSGGQAEPGSITRAASCSRNVPGSRPHGAELEHRIPRGGQAPAWSRVAPGTCLVQDHTRRN